MHVTFLASSDVASADLSRYSSIVLGVRAYAARDELKTYNSRLLDYVKNGGVLIVQYNTPEFDHNFGPYPYEMGSNPEEVTDEVSKIDILDPKNPVFLWPNQITSRDFEGWVEERGSKFLKSWDAHYEALLSTRTKDRSLKRAVCSTPGTVRVFTSTTRTLFTASCRKASRGLPACLRT